MPTPTFQPPQGQQSTAQLQDWIIKLVRDLNYLLGNLDTVNVNRLDAKVIIAQTITATQIATDTITANQIAANAITASEISAGAVTANKISVSQLSAISADMGTLTAGIIIGALIKTANTGARIELNANSLSTFNASGQGQGPNWGNTFGLNYGDVGLFDAGFQTLLMKCLGARTGWQISADSGAAMYLGATGSLTYGMGDWDMQGSLKVHTGTAFDTIVQADSTATTVAGIVADFNTLLANLRLMNILA